MIDIKGILTNILFKKKESKTYEWKGLPCKSLDVISFQCDKPQNFRASDHFSKAADFNAMNT